MSNVSAHLAALKNKITSCFSSSHSWSIIALNDVAVAFDQSGLPPNELMMEVEVAFRTLLAEFKQSNSALQQCPRFIEFSLEFALLHSQFGKIPFLLIDDFIEDVNIEVAKQAWSILEQLSEKLTNENLFNKGKFVMLKTCNFLLKKLSRSYDTEFCGRILLFLSTVYPISEKSAANLPGKININNVTYFDNQETFDTNLSNERQSLASTAKAAASEDIQEEDGEEIEDKKRLFQVSHELYESFWKLQSFFASEIKEFDHAAPTWNDFLVATKKVIAIFQTCYFDEEGSSKQKDSYQGTKYLTSSQLFSLQLRDPLVWQQLAVQLLIFTHYLKVKALPNVEALDKKVDILREVAFIHNEAKKIIESIPSPHSKNLVAVIQRILTREENWIRWKGQSQCAPFERHEKVADFPAVDSELKKRKLEDCNVTLKSGKKVSVTAMANSYLFDCSDTNIKAVASRLAASKPDFEEQIHQYLDADDPDAGIDDEYHPKHNQLYCWRTRRMLMEKDVMIFRHMPDGDLGKGLRKLKNLPEPVPKIEVADEAEAKVGDDENKADATSPKEEEELDNADQMDVDEDEGDDIEDQNESEQEESGDEDENNEAESVNDDGSEESHQSGHEEGEEIEEGEDK